MMLASCLCSSCHRECGRFFQLLACFVSPQRSSSCSLISFERIGISSESGDPRQTLSFVANQTNLLYIQDFIHVLCNRCIVYCFSSIRIYILFLQILRFKPLST
jgi:hypothetical protein